MAPPRPLWRVTLTDGAVVHGVLVPGRKTAIVWYRDDIVEGVEEFEAPAEAEEWARADA